MSTQSEEIKKLLRDLEIKTNGVEASAVISTQGLPICSAMPPEVDEGVIAAMSAAILGVGERALEELVRGKMTRVLVEGGDGAIIIMETGSGAILTVLAKKNTNLGLVFMVMKQAAKKIADILKT